MVEVGVVPEKITPGQVKWLAECSSHHDALQRMGIIGMEFCNAINLRRMVKDLLLTPDLQPLGKVVIIPLEIKWFRDLIYGYLALLLLCSLATDSAFSFLLF